MVNWLEKISPVLRHVGSSGHSSNWVEPQRRIYDHQLVLFTKGRFVVEFASQAVHCEEGSYIIIPPATEHVTRLVSAAGLRCWVHFDWTFVSDTGTRPLMTYSGEPFSASQAIGTPDYVPRERWHGGIQAPVVDLHGQMETLWNAADVRSRLLCRALLLRMLIELFAPADREPSRRDVADPRMERIRESLNEWSNIPVDQTPSIRDHLESFGFSYAHLSRQFRQAYGVSPLAYVNRLRIERAKQLLAAGELSVGAVARSVGIDNPAYFSRLFRRIVGTPPALYAASVRTIHR